MANFDIGHFLDEGMIRLAWAAVLGGIIGLERELTHKSAGLRTHTLVCMGSAIFTMLSISNLDASVPLLTSLAHAPLSVFGGHIERQQDISRICASIVSGIGFIGGGAVLRYGTSIRGVTTAASLWIVASIGMLAGTGNYRLSIFATLLTFIVLYSLGRLGRQVIRKQLSSFDQLRLHVTLDQAQTQAFEQWMHEQFGGAIIESVSTKPDSEHFNWTYTLGLDGQIVNLTQLQSKIAALPGVEQISFNVLQGAE